MSYKVKINGVEIEVGTLEEVRALAGLVPAAPTPVPPRAPPPKPAPTAPLRRPAVEPMPSYEVPPGMEVDEDAAQREFERALGRRLMGKESVPAPSKPALKEEVIPLPYLKGVRVQPMATLDAARAIVIAFQHYGRPVRWQEARKYLTVPGGTGVNLVHRFSGAARRGLIKRVAAGIYVPEDYDPAPLEGVETDTKTLKNLAIVVVHFLADHPVDRGADRADEVWNRASLGQAMAEKLGGKESTHRLKIWAALRLGWMDKSYRLTEAGEEVATSKETS